MKKLIMCFMIVMMLCTSTVRAESSNVTYSGNSGKFIFKPGSEYSVTDLFTEFKGVMPGDSLTQKITVKNEANNKVKVKIYMRSLGAHKDSKDFLSQMNLTVEKSSDNEMGYMFDASADQTDGLSDWVLLGTLYSGGTVNLDVKLNVPVEMDNTYMDQIGYLDWEFMVEEFEIENSDPKPPNTSDNTNIGLYGSLLGISIIVLLILFKKKKS